MLAVTGLNTTIVQSYLQIRPEGVIRIEATPSLSHSSPVLKVPLADRYILAAGVLHQARLTKQTEKEIIESLSVNFINVIRICEEILSRYKCARICVIGSESGFNWSYDDTYAGAKAAVHRYVETRKIAATQPLVCVSPIIISDSGMTMRRNDYPDILDKRRTVTAMAVAEVISGLFSNEIDLNNTVVRM
jgi:NADP-dependent 3-hydroxy acid dehydrogenase YdfG